MCGFGLQCPTITQLLQNKVLHEQPCGVPALSGCVNHISYSVLCLGRGENVHTTLAREDVEHGNLRLHSETNRHAHEDQAHVQQCPVLNIFLFFFLHFCRFFYIPVEMCILPAPSAKSISFQKFVLMHWKNLRVQNSFFFKNLC